MSSAEKCNNHLLFCDICQFFMVQRHCTEDQCDELPNHSVVDLGMMGMDGVSVVEMAGRYWANRPEST